MGFDIIVLKPTDTSVVDISEVSELVPLGTVEVVSAAFHSMFPNCLKGAFVCGEAYSVEGSLVGVNYLGRSASDFLAVLTDVCRRLDAIAFAVSNNSRLSP